MSSGLRGIKLCFGGIGKIWNACVGLAWPTSDGKFNRVQLLNSLNFFLNGNIEDQINYWKGQKAWSLFWSSFRDWRCRRKQTEL